MRYRNPVTGVVSVVPEALAGAMGLVPVVDEAKPAAGRSRAAGTGRKPSKRKQD